LHALATASVNVHTELKVPSFGHTKDVTGTQTFIMGHVTLTTPLSGVIFLSVGWDLLWSTNLPNLKSLSTGHKDMKGDAKCRKWGGLAVVTGHWRSLKIAQFDRAHTSSS